MAREILESLAEQPDRGGTLLCIARWWLLRRRVKVITIQVKQALEELERKGLVVRTDENYRQPMYYLNEIEAKKLGARTRRKTRRPAQER